VAGRRHGPPENPGAVPKPTALTATLRLAVGTTALRRIAGDPGALRWIAEGLTVTLQRVRISIGQRLGVILSSHPEIWEMIEELTENRITVSAISRRIEDVAMPHLIHRPTRDNHVQRMHQVERQELSILGLHHFDSRLVKTGALLGIGQLHLDVAQVKQIVKLLHGGRRVSQLKDGGSAVGVGSFRKQGEPPRFIVVVDWNLSILASLSAEKSCADLRNLRLAKRWKINESKPSRIWSVTKAELHDLVDRLPEGAVDGAALLLEEITDGRIDPEQAWFWTREWQAKEREADDDLAAGRATAFENDGELLGALEADTKPLDADS
jgi:hypothetical protein